MSHHVYILKCADATLYTGYTTDVNRRLAEHNAGIGAKYTRGRGPVKIIHTESYATKSLALQRECEIKNLRRTQKLSLVSAT